MTKPLSQEMHDGWLEFLHDFEKVHNITSRFQEKSSNITEEIVSAGNRSTSSGGATYRRLLGDDGNILTDYYFYAKKYKLLLQL
jgi:hypothetical protein